MSDLPSIALYMILGIELLGSMVIIMAVIQAWGKLIRKDQHAARQMVAEGAINSLSFKLGATLLKTLFIHTWTQIGMLFAVVALRTVLKRLFAWEQKRIQIPHYIEHKVFPR